jgi:hypothetical protein
VEEGGFYRCKSNPMKNKEASTTRLFIQFHLFPYSLSTCRRDSRFRLPLAQSLLLWGESSRVAGVA